jgi:hypothetical protein
MNRKYISSAKSMSFCDQRSVSLGVETLSGINDQILRARPEYYNVSRVVLSMTRGRVCVCYVSSPLSSSYIFTLYVTAEIPKLWGAPPVWSVFLFSRGKCELSV